MSTDAAADTQQLLFQLGQIQLTGRRLAYTLAIPKGDTHDWEDAKVEFFGQSFRTCGGVVQGIESMIPLCWNKKVQVVQFE